MQLLHYLLCFAGNSARWMFSLIVLTVFHVCHVFDLFDYLRG